MTQQSDFDTVLIKTLNGMTTWTKRTNI